MRFSAKSVLPYLLFSGTACADPGWIATLALNGFSNLVGGANAIASSCPKDPQASCAVGAIQTVVGSVLSIAAAGIGANNFFGFWKRDEDGVMTLFVTHNETMGKGQKIHKDHIKELGSEGPIRLQFLLHGDETVRHSAYHFNKETRRHKVYARLDGQPVNLGHSKRQEETIDGDDGYVGDWVEYEIDDLEGTDTSSDTASDYANQIESGLEDNNADSVCVNFDHDSTDDGNLWVQPANDGSFESTVTGCSDPSKTKRQDSVSVNVFTDSECNGAGGSDNSVFTQGQCDQWAGWLGVEVVEGGVNCQAFLTLDCTGQPLTPIVDGQGTTSTFWGSEAGQCYGLNAYPGSFHCVAA